MYRSLVLTALASGAVLLAACVGAESTPCEDGASCAPANACHAGRLGCASGACEDTGVAVADGTACGGGDVCIGGACAPPVCVAGTGCQPEDACRSGTLACASPARPGTCVPAAPWPDGTACGADLVCASGSCVARCAAGAPCELAEPCAVAETACATSWATPVCAHVGSLPDGTPCGAARACRSGVCTGVTLVVVLESPAGTTYANGDVSVAVAVSGGTPDRVDLLLDGAPVLELAPPYLLTWSTSGVAEGTHALSARASLDGVTFDAAARALVVDRTPPVVVARTPAPGATNVWSRDPITVTFSEPLSPASVTDDAVGFADASGALAKVLTLSADGRVLSFRSVLLPPVPNTLGAVLTSKLRDLAGNPLSVDFDDWRWSIPTWQELGIGARSTRHERSDLASAIGGDRSVTLSASIARQLPGEASIGVAQSSGAGWTGASLPLGPGRALISNSVASAGLGSAYVAWSEVEFKWDYENGGPISFGPGHVRLGYWSGAEWFLDPGLDVDPTKGASSPSVALDGDGRAVVAWIENLEAAGSTSIFVKRWTGSAWELLGESPKQGWTSAADLRVGFDPAGRPVIRWTEEASPQLSVWTGTWASITSGTLSFPPPMSNPVGRAGLGGERYVAWVDASATPTTLHVSQFVNSYTALPLGGALNVTSTGAVDGALCFELDLAGRPIVAWLERVPGEEHDRVYVKRWDADGAAWEALGQDLWAPGPGGVAVPDSCELVEERSGVLAMGLGELNSAILGHELRAWRYNR